MWGVLQVAGRGDEAAGAIATAQKGLIGMDQLRSAGLARGAIAHRVDRARLRRVHRGVFLVGHAAGVAWAQEMAALLACGLGSVLGQRSATAILGCLQDPGAIDVVVPPGRDPRPRGVCVHRRDALTRAEVVLRDGLPITSPLVTFCDLGAVVDRRTLERAVAEAIALRLVTERELVEAIGATPTRRGPRALAALLRAVGEPAMTRNDAELLLLELIRRAGLPRPGANARVAGLEVDFAWLDRRLVVELDSFGLHTTRAKFERDRWRDRKLRALGFTVIRVTWRQLAHEPEAILVDIATALARAA